MTAASLWARLAAVWIVAALLLAAATPPEPTVGWSVLASGAVGTAAGVGLFAGLLRRRVPLAPVRFTTAAVLALTAGAEEVTWRWFALASLAPRTGVVAALALTSVAFAFAHPAGRPMHVVSGVVFGALFLLTGTLAAPWAAHASYNLLAASARMVDGSACTPARNGV